MKNQINEVMAKNSNYTTKSNQVIENSEDGSPLFEMMEVLFGLEVEALMLICQEGETLWGNKYMLPDSVVYAINSMDPDDCLRRAVKTIKSTEFNFTSVSSIYEQTSSGFNSIEHPINNGLNWCDAEFKRLIPVVLLTMVDVTLSFRLDNRIIRELFFLSEEVLEVDNGIIVGSRKFNKVVKSEFYRELMKGINILYGVK